MGADRGDLVRCDRSRRRSASRTAVVSALQVDLAVSSGAEVERGVSVKRLSSSGTDRYGSELCPFAL